LGNDARLEARKHSRKAFSFRDSTGKQMRLDDM
jgi:hypothetical protein